MMDAFPVLLREASLLGNWAKLKDPSAFLFTLFLRCDDTLYYTFFRARTPPWTQNPNLDENGSQRLRKKAHMTCLFRCLGCNRTW